VNYKTTNKETKRVNLKIWLYLILFFSFVITVLIIFNPFKSYEYKHQKKKTVIENQRYLSFHHNKLMNEGFILTDTEEDYFIFESESYIVYIADNNDLLLQIIMKDENDSFILSNNSSDKITKDIKQDILVWVVGKDYIKFKNIELLFYIN
jgi:hypothetical protein